MTSVAFTLSDELASLSMPFSPAAQRKTLSGELFPSIEGMRGPASAPLPPFAPVHAPRSLAMPSVLAECEQLVAAALAPAPGQGTTLGAARGAKTAVTASASLAALFENTGVVLLNPADVPVAAELPERFLPVFDKFLLAHAINVHESIDEEVDPRKFKFIERVRHVRDLFRGEVQTVMAMCAQFSDALQLQLRRQALERVVSRDEHAVKCMTLVDKFRKVLDALLEQTRALVLKMHKSFMSVYSDKPSERAVRLAMPLTYGEAMFTCVQTSSGGSGGGSVTSSRRAAAGARPKAQSQVPLEVRQQERDEWLRLWNDVSANTSDDKLPQAKLRGAAKQNPARTATLKRVERHSDGDDALSVPAPSTGASTSSSSSSSSSEELSEVVVVAPSMVLQSHVSWPAATSSNALSRVISCATATTATTATATSAVCATSSSLGDVGDMGGGQNKRVKSAAVAEPIVVPLQLGVCVPLMPLDEAFPIEQWLAAIDMDDVW